MIVIFFTLSILLLNEAARLPPTKFGGSSPNLSPTAQINRPPLINENDDNFTYLVKSVKNIEDSVKKIQQSVSDNERSMKKILRISEIYLNHSFYNSCEDYQRREEYYILSVPKPTSNVINLVPSDGHLSKEVRCEIDESGYTWTVILDRQSGRVGFDRTYAEYEQGFGDVKEEYYIGNRALNELTSIKRYIMRIELKDARSQQGWAQYKLFKVASSVDGYRLTLGEYDRQSTVGDGLQVNNGQEFSTYDKHSKKNCSRNFGGNGGWWFRTGAKIGCYNSLPTGVYRPEKSNLMAGGISYEPWPKALKPLTKFKILMRASSD